MIAEDPFCESVSATGYPPIIEDPPSDISKKNTILNSGKVLTGSMWRWHSYPHVLSSALHSNSEGKALYIEEFSNKVPCLRSFLNISLSYIPILVQVPESSANHVEPYKQKVKSTGIYTVITSMHAFIFLYSLPSKLLLLEHIPWTLHVDIAISNYQQGISQTHVGFDWCQNLHSYLMNVLISQKWE